MRYCSSVCFILIIAAVTGRTSMAPVKSTASMGESTAQSLLSSLLSSPSSQSSSQASSTFITSFKRHKRTTAHHRRVVILNSKTGYNLAIDGTGLVYGSSSFEDCNAHLQLESDDRGVVRIRGIASGKYLAFNQQGRLTTTNDRNTSRLNFIEEFNPNEYNTYRSEEFLMHHHNWYVALNGRGKPIKYRRRSSYHSLDDSKFFLKHVMWSSHCV